MFRLDVQGMTSREMNKRIRSALQAGELEIVLKNVNGQRYIGTGLVEKNAVISIWGVPGNDLGAFMDGPRITVWGNAQDGVANTMNAGEIIIHGDAGDVLAYGMRSGKLFIAGSVGYRVGIHMKEYQQKIPVLVIGGTAGAFLGEYMAGGRLVLLGAGKSPAQPLAGKYLGTGMHGGVIYYRGTPDKNMLGAEVAVRSLEDEDWKFLKPVLQEFATSFTSESVQLTDSDFTKIIPVSNRPYGRLYTD